jgi:hypothetical protein
MCDQETIVGREGLEDADGEFTGEHAILAQCNGAMSTNCGWSYQLDGWGPNWETEWFITNKGMEAIHAHHQAGTSPNDEKLVDLL